MQQHPIPIPSLTRANFPAWVASIILKAGALGLTAALHDSTFTPDPLLVRTLASITNPILDSIPTDTQSEAIHGNAELQYYPLLHAIHNKLNRNSTADNEAVGIKASCILFTNFETLDDYFVTHRAIRSQMLAATYPDISQEQTSIKFIIRVLADFPDFQYVLTTWASQPPPRI